MTTHSEHVGEPSAHNQPKGRMTIMALPDHLKDFEWDSPQEIEVRVAGELILYGLTTGIGLTRVEASCANPECEGHCRPSEMLQMSIDIAPVEEEP